MGFVAFSLIPSSPSGFHKKYMTFFLRPAIIEFIFPSRPEKAASGSARPDRRASRRDHYEGGSRIEKIKRRDGALLL